MYQRKIIIEANGSVSSVNKSLYSEEPAIGSYTNPSESNPHVSQSLKSALLLSYHPSQSVQNPVFTLSFSTKTF
jgi:hypothetical protein